MEYDIYLKECFEIEAALESLINLSDIVEDIAIEAAISVDEKKKNLAAKKLGEAWIEKFKKWEKKFTRPVTLFPGIDERDFTQKAREIINTYTYELWNADDPKSETRAQVREYISDLKRELRRVEKRTGKDPVVKTGPFKELRTKILSSMKKNLALVEKERYASRIQSQIKLSNEILECLDMLAKPCKNLSNKEFVEQYNESEYNRVHRMPRLPYGAPLETSMDRIREKEKYELKENKKKKKAPVKQDES